MRISDWSSDVCSSDLDLDRQILGAEQEIAAHRGAVRIAIGIAHRRGDARRQFIGEIDAARPEILVQVRKGNARRTAAAGPVVDELVADGVAEIGRASWWDRVCQYVYISEVAGALKKNK